MRVIAGSAKRIPLKSKEGLETRPTTDRIKETLFNMISHQLFESKFLDLFAGSGAIGIEALSRGAKEAVFIESDKEALNCILFNLKKTKLEERGRCILSSVDAALSTMGEAFDYIFLDPPYGKGLEKTALRWIAEKNLLAEQGLIILEVSKQEDLSYLDALPFQLIKRKVYKTNQHIFLEEKKEEGRC